MQETPTKSKNTTPLKLFIDIGIFLAYLIAMDPRSSGIALHEWLTVVGTTIIVVHILLSWDWIAQITGRFLGKVVAISRLNYILNWLLFIDGILIMLSGLLISEQVMPALGIQLPRNFAWRGLHEMSTNLGVILLGLHTALHWSWVVNAFKRYLIQPIARIFAPKPKETA